MTSSSACDLGVGGEVGDAAAAVVHLRRRRASCAVTSSPVTALITSGPVRNMKLSLGHDHEVGERRRVDGAAGARPEDQRDLRDDAGGHHVAHEHLAVGGEAAHALLDARAARVVEADQRDAALERQVLDAADLLRLHLGERAAEDGEVLREDRDAPAVDLAEAGDDAVAGEALLVQAESVHVVRGERAELLERALVEQQREPLARRELAARVLLLDALLAAAEHRAAAHLAQFA